VRLAAFLLGLAALASSCAIGMSDGLAPGTPAPALVVDDWVNTDAPIDLADLVEEGEAPVLVEFWSKDCSPCRGRIEEMQAIHADFGDRLRVVTVHVSLERQAPRQDAAAVRAFVAEWGIEYPVAIPQTGDALDAFEFRFLPHALLLDTDGTVVWSANAGSGDVLDAVEDLLGPR